MRTWIPDSWLPVAILCGLMHLGCGTNYGTAAITESQTLIGIDPYDFVVDGACGHQLNSYVATLYDETGAAGLDDAGVSKRSFRVASTPPKGCEESTVFSNVVAEHAYRVELEGYHQLAAELRPATDGSSAMLLQSDGSYVPPAWNAACHGWTDNQGNSQPGYSYGYVTMMLSVCSRLGSEL